MRGHQDDAQAWPGQHHRDFGRAGQRCQQFGMAGIIMPARLQCFLVERRRDQGFDLARQGELGGGAHIFMRGMAGHGRDHAEGQARRQQLDVEAIHRARFEARLPGIGDHADGKCRARNVPGLGQPQCIAHHKGTAIVIDVAMRQRLHHDFGTDAGGVAHGDGDAGFAHGTSVTVRARGSKTAKNACFIGFAAVPGGGRSGFPAGWAGPPGRR